MRNPTEIPVDELEGRLLNAAVHEEVFGQQPFAVTEGDLEAKQSMSGVVDDDPLRNAFCAEAMEYPEEQRSIGCPRYSSEKGKAAEVDEFMRERPDALTIASYIELRSRRQDLSERRGCGKEFDEVTFQPEAVCRDALRAIRNDDQSG